MTSEEPPNEEDGRRMAGKVADSARKQHQADASGNFADQKAADAAYDEMIAEARRQGLLDNPDEE